VWSCSSWDLDLDVAQHIQMLISSGNTLTDTLGNNVLPGIWVSFNQWSWHLKFTITFTSLSVILYLSVFNC
jgi:hypothetical protein